MDKELDDTLVQAHPLIGIARTADIASAARLMVQEDIGALGVYSVDGHELLGIVTERDVTRTVARGLDARTTHVVDVMTAQPIVVTGHLTHAAAARLMREGHVRHLLVREDGADLMISIRDL